MAEAFWVLQPSGLVVYDVMTIRADAVMTYPMPWSEVPESGEIHKPQSYKNTRTAAGYISLLLQRPQSGHSAHFDE